MQSNIAELIRLKGKSAPGSTIATVEDALTHFKIAAQLHSEFDCPLSVVQALVDRADSAYYRQGLTPLMSDAEYDYLKTCLRKVSPNDERLTRVGVPYDASELRQKVKHTFPMGSLDNTDGGIDGLEPWYNSVCEKLGSKPPICLSHKVDGASVRARYEDGKLVQVATRGNGSVGEDITANGSNFIGLPSVLNQPVTCDVRGEAILFKSDFRAICERDFGVPFDQIDPSAVSNPRNIGNGILGRSDGQDSNLLCFMAFNIVMDRDFESHSEKNKFMEELGFTVVSYGVCADVAEVRRQYDVVAAYRSTMAYEIDGLVVVLDPVSAQNHFITSDVKSQLRPKHSRAIKFPHKSNTTIIEGVTLTVGHTGAIIPTAKLREVRVGGVNVTNALLNNWDEIERLDVAIGDEVEVVLAGDIIPKIVAKVADGANRTPIAEPDRCPVCGEVTTRNIRGKSGAVTYCSSKRCPAAMLAKVDHWIGSSKKGVGILGIGDTILKALWDNEVISTPADLYTLTVDQMKDVTLDGGGRIGESRATTIVDNISATRTLALHTFLGSLGVELLGRRRAQKMIADAGGRLDTIDQWLQTVELSKMEIPGCGPTIMETIALGIEDNRELIKDLLAKGVVIQASVISAPPPSGDSSDLPFSGFSFVLTGTRECEDDIVRLGGKMQSGISKKTSFLVQKDATSSSNKTKKADEYGVKVISLDYLKRAVAGEVKLEPSNG